MFIRVKTQGGDVLLNRDRVVSVSVGVNAVFFDLAGATGADSCETIRLDHGKRADALDYIHRFLNNGVEGSVMDLTPFQEERGR